MVKKIKVCFVQVFVYVVFNPALGSKIARVEIVFIIISNSLIESSV